MVAQTRPKERDPMSEWELKKNGNTPPKGPVLIVVMDGVGLGAADEGDAVHLARTPNLDRIWSDYPTTRLRAHGTAVGLPSDKDMGNSEVGHNALGSGKVYAQGAKLVNRAIEDGSLFGGETWQTMLKRCIEHDTPMHFIGLLSDGNVHSHIEQLFAMIRACAQSGLRQVCVHPLLDGRDVPETSALEYIDALEAVLTEINAGGEGRSYRVASGGGRMLVTMDRYEANWSVVERGWRAHVLGEGRPFSSARAAIETYRTEDPELIDQFTPEFVVVDEGGVPLGRIEDGHSVVFFNYRGDRGIEISRAFDQDEFSHFDRVRRPDVIYAGMMQYDGDLLIPKTFLVTPPKIERTMGEYLARNGVRQFACSETQKYGHVTYFWNGNRGGKFDDATETYVEVRSDIIPFEQRPWMKAAEITDATLQALASGAHPFMRINYANGDMVGHTGDREATILAVQTVDLALERVLSAMRKLGGITIITADHGNADQMYEIDKKSKAFKLDEQGQPCAKTAHTLNPVPLTIVGPMEGYELDPTLEGPGLSNVAATALTLMGYVPPEGFDPPLIRPR
jgi:2,3-bisphosphoglycerate-independent phosphoglycerate mutase